MDYYPLSSAELGMYLEQRMQPDSISYNLNLGFVISGADLNSIRASVHKLIKTHAALHSRYGYVDGSPVKIPVPEEQYPVVEDGPPLTEAEFAQLLEEDSTPFDLDKGVPVVFTLHPIIVEKRAAADNREIKTAGTGKPEIETSEAAKSGKFPAASDVCQKEYALHMKVHHIAFDGNSTPVFIKDLLDSLSGVEVTELERDSSKKCSIEKDGKEPFAEELRIKESCDKKVSVKEPCVEEKCAIEKSVPSLVFYEKMFEGGVPVNDMPLKGERPNIHPQIDSVLSETLDKDSFGLLKKTATGYGLTIFELLFAISALTLSKYCSTRDVVLGVPVDTRDKDEKNTIGIFVETLPIRVKIEPEQDVAAYFSETGKRVRCATKENRVPFEILKERFIEGNSPSRSPFYDISINYLRLPAEETQGNIKIRFISPLQKMKRDMSFIFYREASEIRTTLQYASGLFDGELVKNFLEQFMESLHILLWENPTKIQDLLRFPEKQLQQLEAFSYSAQESVSEDAPVLLHKMLEKAASLHPDRMILHASDRSLTLSELNREANAIALKLSQMGLGQGDRVLLLLKRCSYYFTALFGVLKAGAAFIPCDKHFPNERIQAIYEDSGAKLIITEDETAEEWESLTEGHALSLTSLIGKGSEISPKVELSPTEPAYMIYTSGSTGKPKGVILSHRGITNYFKPHEVNIFYNLMGKEAHKILSITTMAFDMSLKDSVGMIVNGIPIVFADETEMNDPKALVQLIKTHGIDAVSATPSRYLQYMEYPPFMEALKNCRLIIAGGEAYPKQLLKKLQKETKALLLNSYGPTEITVSSNMANLTTASDVHIGKPLLNYREYIVDNKLNPVPTGVTGQLLIGGPGVALGYQGLKKETEEKFINYRGERFFCSGDYAKWDKDGNVRILGRMDTQVKLRGLRIELGEIETRLTAIEGIKRAAVAVKKLMGQDHLCAYYISDTEYDPSDLKAALSKSLTDYMIPEVFMRLEAFPLTPGGKTDVKALPEPRLTHKERDLRPPENKTERKVYEILSEVLKTEDFGMDTPFNELGLNSLAMVGLMIKLGEAFSGHEIGFADFREHNTPAAIAELLSEASEAKVYEIRTEYPITRTQYGIYVECLSHPGSTIYNIPSIMKLDDSIDLERLTCALIDTIDAHPYLKVRLRENDGEVIALRDDSLPPRVERIKLDGFLNPEDLVKPYDLTKDELYRAKIIEAVEGNYLFFELHHIIGDGVSGSILKHDIEKAYLRVTDGNTSEHSLRQNSEIAGKKEPERSSSDNDLKRGANSEHLENRGFTGYEAALLEEERRESTRFNEAKEWYEKLLSGSEMTLIPPLPERKPAQAKEVRPKADPAQASESLTEKEAVSANDPLPEREPAQVIDARPKTEPAQVSESLTEREAVSAEDPLPERESSKNIGTESLETSISSEALYEFCRKKSITPNAYFNGVFGYTLSLWTATKDVVFTTIYNGRNDARLSETVCMLVKTLPVRLNFEADERIEKTLGETSKQLTGSMEYDIYSFAEIAREYGITADLMLAYQGEVTTEKTFCNTTVKELPLSLDEAKSALSIEVRILNGKVDFLAEYRPTTYSKAFVSAFLESLEQISKEFMLRERLSDIRPVSAETEEAIKTLHDTDWPVGKRPAYRLLQDSAKKYPEHTALIAKGRRFTYRELNAAANQMGHYLKAKGLKVGEICALMLHRGSEVYIARQGILTAGGAFLSIDPAYPDERISFILQDAGVKYLITTENLYSERKDFLNSLGVSICLIEALEKEDLSTEDLNICVPSDSLAYCIYTSGSTGKPKGVMLTQRNLVNFVDNNPKNRETLGYIEKGHVSLSYAAITFDVSIMEEFIPLSHGLTACMASDEEIYDLNALSQLCIENNVDILTCTPSFLSNALDVPAMRDAIKGIKVLDAGAEAFPPALYGRLHELNPDIYIMNGYGPTEATISCTMAVIEDGDQVTIGIPNGNVKVAIVDDRCRILPVGALGELVIMGEGVGKGYINRDDLTEKCFIRLWERPAYRSGDLARLLPDGNIDFRGRRDNQVKLRGLRIELDEIEGVMGDCPGIRLCKVIVCGEGDEAFLAGYYTAKRKIEPDELKEFLGKTLASYMVPEALLQLDEMPLTSNGKIDKKQLPIIQNVEHKSDYVPPENEIEAAFCSKFADILKLDKVGALDDFFTLGGTSLSAMRLVAFGMEKGWDIVFNNVFDYKTPRALANFLMKRSGGNAEKTGTASAPAQGGSHSESQNGSQSGFQSGSQSESQSENQNGPQCGPQNGSQNGSQSDNQNGLQSGSQSDNQNEPQSKTQKALQCNTVSYLKGLSKEDLHPLGTVLLTGSTGFLGIHVLRELIREDGEAEIICLVRDREDMSGERHLKSLLVYYFDNDYDEAFKSRIKTVSADITDSALSDTLSDYNIDTIINCAAIVKHFEAGNLIERVNLGGVRNLISLAEKKDAKLIQISTESVAGYSVNGSVPDTAVFKENCLNIGQTLGTKYTLSKYHAEEELLQAISAGSLRGKIVRVGNLMGRRDDGEFQVNFKTNGFMNRLKAYKTLGSFPLGDLDSPVEFSPVDETARAILLLSKTPDCFTVFHADNCHYIHMANVLEAFFELGVNLDRVEDEVFFERMMEALYDEEEEASVSSLISYKTNSGEERHPVRCSNEFTVKLLYRLGFSWSIVTLDYVQRAIKALMTMGFFRNHKIKKDVKVKRCKAEK